MAKNDVVLVDGIIDQRLVEGHSRDRGEVFELFVLEQLLKDYDLSDEDIDAGWIDGQDDGGIDGFYTFVNGHSIDDPSDFAWPKRNASLEIWLITCKHHDTFQQAPLDLLLATITEIFDLSVDNASLKGPYSTDLLAARSLFHYAYKRLSITQPAVTFNIVYASRGDSENVGESVATRGRQIETSLSSLFSQSDCRFRFVGAEELITLHRRSKSFALDLPFVERLSTNGDSHVLLVRLGDYWKFVSDDAGHLRRYLFDSNVRDYLGPSPVNSDIEKSLADEGGPDFWWLNNGVTILATHASAPGKTMQLQDIQIVNGLQTTETIHEHFRTGATTSKERALLVKVLISSDEKWRDQVIWATNNQNPIEVTALHATDKIQRDIDQVLERAGWFYERRRNYYRNIGKPSDRFITPLYLASAVVSILFKNPAKATRLKMKFMRNQVSNDAVFSENYPISVWPVLAAIYRQVDHSLMAVATGERFIGTWRPLTALLAVAKRIGSFSFSADELVAQFKSKPLTDTEVKEAWTTITKVDSLTHNGRNRVSAWVVQRCCEHLAAMHEISAPRIVGTKQIPAQSVPSTFVDTPLPIDFLNAVDMILLELTRSHGQVVA